MTYPLLLFVHCRCALGKPKPRSVRSERKGSNTARSNHSKQGKASDVVIRLFLVCSFFISRGVIPIQILEAFASLEVKGVNSSFGSCDRAGQMVR